jgi:hypothetical protein
MYASFVFISKGWLIKNKPSECRDVSASFLPDHDLESTPEEKKIIKAATEAVFEILSPNLQSGIKPTPRKLCYMSPQSNQLSDTDC